MIYHDAQRLTRQEAAKYLGFNVHYFDAISAEIPSTPADPSNPERSHKRYLVEDLAEWARKQRDRHNRTRAALPASKQKKYDKNNQWVFNLPRN